MKVELTDKERNMFRNNLAKRILRRAIEIYIHVEDQASYQSANGLGIKVESHNLSISQKEYDRLKAKAKEYYQTFKKLGFDIDDFRQNVENTNYDVPTKFVIDLIKEE